MHSIRLAKLTTAAAFLGVLSACGSGGSDQSRSGSINFRALWEQSPGIAAMRKHVSRQQEVGGFGPEIPPSVRTARVIFRSERFQCCVAFDPRSEVFAERRLLILTDLPAGPATVELAGFPLDFAPAEGVGDVCATKPLGSGFPCSDSAANPSFNSAPRPVEVVAGARTDAGTILVFSFPFIVDGTLAPPSGTAVVAPLQVRFTVVDAVSGIDSESIAVFVDGRDLSTALLGCADGGDGVPCSENGLLDVSGFRVLSGDLFLPAGPVRLRIIARNLEGRELNFEYEVTVQRGPDTGTPTDTPTSTATRTATAEDTATVTPAATLEATLTPTATSTTRPTTTPTSSLTPTSTATSSSTATPTATPTDTATPAPTATDTDTPTEPETPTPTNTPTATPAETDTATPAPTATDTDTPTEPETPTPTNTPTATPAETDTATPAPTATDTDTPTEPETPTPTNTPTATPAETDTATPAPTATDTDTPTEPETPTPTNTPTATPAETDTATPEVVDTPTATPSPTEEIEDRVLSGTVVNCLDAQPITGALVRIVSPITAEQITASGGRFRFEMLPTGLFVVEALGDGFRTTQVRVELGPMRMEESVTIAICPVDDSELRIVLTWGSDAPAPPDLDSHLRGPAPGVFLAGEIVEFHVYFANSEVNFPNESTAKLDIDDTSFEGPETITVSRVTAGLYRYCVHDYTNRANVESAALSMSSARVQVFLDGAQIGQFEVPEGVGTVWEVFTLDTTMASPVLTPINVFANQRDSRLVCHRQEVDPDGDGLTDAQETEFGTNPAISDSDGNGRSDGQDAIDSSGSGPLWSFHQEAKW